MIRLPPTGIDISPNDLDFHLHQLDIYQGLLKQGFKKNEIINYFKDQNVKFNDNENAAETSDPIPSTVELCAKSLDAPETQARTTTTQESSPDPLHASRSPSLSPECPVSSKHISRQAAQARSLSAADKGYAPRQSSLLQYSKAISPDTFSGAAQSSIRIPLSPRANISYRPRSQKYSHEQSEIDANAFTQMVDTGSNGLHHPSLDNDLVPTVTGSEDTNIRGVSDLRPEAESFTPISLRQVQSFVEDSLKGKEKADDSSESDSFSMPSSPPLLPLNAESRRSPSLPRMPRTPPEQHATEPVTARRQIYQQYLDGSFSIYDDSVPARLQPQTPADLGHGRTLDLTNAAFTAPPGMIRSPMPSQGRYIHGTRQPSGDQSPTTRALVIRQRRQREFDRGARVEELRVSRVRTEQTEPRREDMQISKDFWRDDLDADGVGEENFEDLVPAADVQRLRTISGNRRA